MQLGCRVLQQLGIPVSLLSCEARQVKEHFFFLPETDRQYSKRGWQRGSVVTLTRLYRSRHTEGWCTERNILLLLLILDCER